MKAIWNGKVLADSDETIVVEGNHYFPPESLVDEYFTPSAHQRSCFWKGTAFYFSLVVDGETNENAAWYYPAPLEKAVNITNYVAFWKGVEVV